MWTSYKALYLKKGPLDRLAELSNSMGELFQWKSNHFEDIPWTNFNSEAIISAMNIYYWNEAKAIKETEESLKKKGKKQFLEEKRPKQPRITRSKLLFLFLNTNGKFAIAFCIANSKFAIAFFKIILIFLKVLSLLSWQRNKYYFILLMMHNMQRLQRKYLKLDILTFLPTI